MLRIREACYFTHPLPIHVHPKSDSTSDDVNNPSTLSVVHEVGGKQCLSLQPFQKYHSYHPSEFSEIPPLHTPGGAFTPLLSRHVQSRRPSHHKFAHSSQTFSFTKRSKSSASFSEQCHICHSPRSCAAFLPTTWGIEARAQLDFI